MSLSRRDFLKSSAAASAAAAIGMTVPADLKAQADVAEGGWRWDKAACRFCGTGCGIMLATKEGKIVAVKGDPAAPVNRGLNCIKGYFNAKIMYGADRLKQPLLRMNAKGEFDKKGDFAPVSWKRAFDEMEVHIKSALKEKGPEGIGIFASGQYTIMEGYAAQKMMKAGFRSNAFDPNARHCMASAVTGFYQTFGIDEPSGCYDDIELTDTIVSWGSNMAEMHPILWSRVTDRKLSNPDKVKILYKKLIYLNLNDTSYKSMLNHQADYFVKNKNMDLDIVYYLQNTIINYPEKERELNPTQPLHDAINSIRGSALHTLMFCYYDKNFEEIIFSTIEKIISKPLCNDSLKVMILHLLGYLNYLNIERAFKIFVELTKTDNLEILKSSLNTAQYFNNKYHADMNYYFETLLNNSELHKQSYLLISSWLLGLDNEKKLYYRFISTGKNAKLCAIDVSEEFLINEGDKTVNKDALSILYEFINEKDKDIADEYAFIILRKFKPNNFVDFFDFLKEYSKSELCRKHPNYFLQYLLCLMYLDP